VGMQDCGGYYTFSTGSPRIAIVRIGMIAFGLFLLSGFKSCTELRYVLGAKDATARVTRVHEERARRNRRAPWTVSYKFQNADTGDLQRGRFQVNQAAVAQYTLGDEIAVEYYGPTQVDSRPKGDSNMPWVYAFVGSLAFCVGATAILSWQSMRAECRDRRRGRLPPRVPARRHGRGNAAGY
jgi:hypothetical protein